MTSINVRELFVKMENSDSDYRFMAASDLLTALTNHSIKVDPDTQKKVCIIYHFFTQLSKLFLIKSHIIINTN